MIFDRTIRRLAGNVGNKLRRLGSDEFIAATRRASVKPGTVLYEAFSGNGMVCQPEAIFRAALADPELAHLRHIWVLSDLERYSGSVAEFADHPRVRFVRYRSPQYHYALATSEYLVNNSTFPTLFAKQPDQTYVNTWHGTPLKQMGYDMPGKASEVANTLRNFIAADFLLSSCRFMTDTMYRNAYRLGEFYDGIVLETGSPRCDHQFSADGARERLRSAGVDVGDGPIVLYAPTWRGESFHTANAELVLLTEALDGLRRGAATSGATILLKVHQQVLHQVADEPAFKGRLVPNDIPTNIALSTADVLVTDYSSLFFDYLSLDRPVIFHVPDLERYREDRGWYVPVDEWPGSITGDTAELAHTTEQVLADNERPDVVARRRQAATEYCPRDDGSASARVVDAVFKKRHAVNHVVRLGDTDKVRLLVYLGGMGSNGITTSALSLLENIDHNAYDVSVLYEQSSDKEILGNIAKIHTDVRQFPRLGPMRLGQVDRLRRQRLLTEGDHNDFRGRQRIMKLFDIEWRRTFGDSRFDHVIDFSGYSAFWAYILLASNAPATSIWLHNDLAADAQREVNGVRPHAKALGAVFTLYPKFDHLVSVSEILAEINRDKLSHHADPSKFEYARNFLPIRRIDEMIDLDGPVRSSLPPAAPESFGTLDGVVEDLLRRFKPDQVTRAIANRSCLDRWLPDRGDVTTFVTVGRLSPEKNHARLVEAFALVHAEHPNTRLVIIGDGPLSADTKRLVDKLGVAKAVSLTGHQANPYLLLQHANCFVMSSDYEGQPMVILEARYLGLPIVVTAFGSASGAVAEGEGIIVDRSAVALAEGMRTFLRGEVPHPPFDAYSYNRAVAGEFERALGLLR